MMPLHEELDAVSWTGFVTGGSPSLAWWAASIAAITGVTMPSIGLAFLLSSGVLEPNLALAHPVAIGLPLLFGLVATAGSFLGLVRSALPVSATLRVAERGLILELEHPAPWELSGARAGWRGDWSRFTLSIPWEDIDEIVAAHRTLHIHGEHGHQQFRLAHIQADDARKLFSAADRCKRASQLQFQSDPPTSLMWRNRRETRVPWSETVGNIAYLGFRNPIPPPPPLPPDRHPEVTVAALRKRLGR